jgi:hypothetical protein
MSLIKRVDSKLMRLFTYNLLYPDWSQAPLKFPLYLVFLFLFLVCLSIASALWQPFNRTMSWVLTALWLVLALYHFRLWRRLKSNHDGQRR